MFSNRYMQPEQGFTLIEVLIAMLVLGIALAAMLSTMLSNTQLNNNLEQRSQAVRLTEGILEKYRQSANYGALAVMPAQTEEVSVNGQPLKITTTFCPSSKPKELVCSASAVYIRVEVKNADKIIHSAETYYTTFGRES